jgi:hypothetical protein
MTLTGSPGLLCEKNSSQQSAATRFAQNSSAQLLFGQLFGKAQCNIDVCARFYSSFDPADCTYLSAVRQWPAPGLH